MSKNVKDIMSSSVVWVAPTTKVTEIAKKMEQNDCGCVLVGENDRLTGIITDRDIALRCVAKGKNPAECTAKDVMTAKILYCKENDKAQTVAENMASNQVRRLVVLNSSKRMVGIVSLGDIAAEGEPASSGAALQKICQPGSKKKAAA